MKPAKPDFLSRLLLPGIVSALLVGSYFLFAGGPTSNFSRSQAQLWNLGHIPFFYLLTLLLIRWPRLQGHSRPVAWGMVLALTFLGGVGIEVLQYAANRDPGWLDVGRNMAGVLTALAFTSVAKFRVNRPYRVPIRAVTLLILIGLSGPFLKALVDEITARQQFPVLSDFSTPFELDRWEGPSDRTLVNAVHGRAGRQMKIDLQPGLYPGAGMKYLPVDWRDYQTLNLDLYSAGMKPLRLTLRVHDWRHQNVQPAYQFDDRYNYSIMLQPGWNRLSYSLQAIKNAPKDRPMDMARIADVSFFITRLRAPVTLYLDRIYLSR